MIMRGRGRPRPASWPSMVSKIKPWSLVRQSTACFAEMVLSLHPHPEAPVSRRHRYQFRVPFADVDHAGIVYYPRLFHYFHLAYEDFFHRELQFPFQRWFEGDEAIIAPIVEAQARFLSPLRHGDEVEAQAWISKLAPTGWDWRFELWVGEQLCASGEVAHAFVHRESLRRTRLPQSWQERVRPWLQSDT